MYTSSGVLEHERRAGTMDGVSHPRYDAHLNAASGEGDTKIK
jgi:hypothetical protein